MNGNCKLIKKLHRLPAAVIVSLIAFFELCFTGRADRAWRLARRTNGTSNVGAISTAANPQKPRRNHSLISIAGTSVLNSPPPVPVNLTRLVIVIAAAILIITAALFSVDRPNGLSLHQLEDGVAYGASIQASGTATEGQSSRMSKAKLTVLGCVTFLYLVIFGLVIRGRIELRRESRNGKERQEAR